MDTSSHQYETNSAGEETQNLFSKEHIMDLVLGGNIAEYLKKYWNEADRAFCIKIDENKTEVVEIDLAFEIFCARFGPKTDDKTMIAKMREYNENLLKYLKGRGFTPWGIATKEEMYPPKSA